MVYGLLLMVFFISQVREKQVYARRWLKRSPFTQVISMKQIIRPIVEPFFHFNTYFLQSASLTDIVTHICSKSIATVSSPNGFPKYELAFNFFFFHFVSNFNNFFFICRVENWY